MAYYDKNGKRGEWQFEYATADLAKAAVTKAEFRRKRVEIWRHAKEEVMAKIKADGLEVTEDIAEKMLSASNYGQGPSVRVKGEYLEDMRRCVDRINVHFKSAREYEGWAEMLKAQGASRVKLSIDDWLYFFGEDKIVGKDGKTEEADDNEDE